MGRVYKILVVDDDRSASDNIMFLLNKKGFDTSSVSSSLECYEFLGKQKPDLILLDVMLPDIPGPELTKALKHNAAYADIPIILISGLKVSPEDKKAGLECGASDYITRPVNNEDLVLRIRSALMVIRDNEARQSSERETAVFRKLGKHETSETSLIFSSGPLRIQYPESFENAVKEYVRIIDNAIDERFYKTDNQIRDKISQLSSTICFLKAGAKDIIEIHRNAISIKAGKIYSKEATIIVEEARYILLEIMGNMINYYRKKSF